MWVNKKKCPLVHGGTDMVRATYTSTRDVITHVLEAQYVEHPT